MVSFAPRLVSVDTMITGVGRRRMIFSRKSSPFMLGISMSRVTTSRAEFLDRIAGLECIAGFAHDFDLRVCLQRIAHQETHCCGVINDQYADWLHDRTSKAFDKW